MSAAVLLYSGGADSTLCAILLRELGHDVHALTVLFDGRPSRELESARALAGDLGFASFSEVRLDGLAIGAPTWVEDRHAHDEGLIPYRNLVFWSLAANKAAEVGADAVAAGHTSYDAESYDDASPRFFASLGQALRFSGLGARGRDLRVLLPLANLAPAELTTLLLRHREVLRRTWSCWRDGATPCGACFACRERTFESLAAK